MFAQLRQQFYASWQRQSATQRLTLALLVVGAAVAIGLFATWAATPTYAVAFSGLSEADAGQIVEKLAEEGTLYRLQGAGTILVPTDEVYDVRLRMANAGLPEGGTVGYELFSGTSSFGMTEFTQEVTYRRALEGELERTIASLASVEAVRVHIVVPERTLLASEQSPATASVTVKVAAGATLDSAQVRAITHLVASSVEGMRPDSVAVVDVNGNLLAAGSGETGSGAPAAQSDARRAAEAAASADLQSRVRQLLDTVLGPNRSVVQATVALDWTERETTTQAFDPEAAALLSSQVIHEAYSATGGSLSGIPGAVSNLPTPVPTAVGDTTASTYERTEETHNYEVTQTQSHETVAPGAVERVSLSVMVDGLEDPAQIDTLRTVIAAAAGIDEARGDVLAVETLAFDRTYFDEQAAEMESGQRTDLYLQIGQAVAGVLVVAALLWYAMRVLKNLRLSTDQAWTPILKPASEAALTAPSAARLTGASEAGLRQLAQPAAVPAGYDREDEQMKRVVSRLADENPASVAEIIHLWLSEEEKKRG